jgi:coenzyme F420-reducing hydrogenase delta subunit
MSMTDVLIIYCAEGAKKALMRMGELGYNIPENARLFELPCSGRVNEVLLMNSFERGCKGILVVGCHRENCRYISGNLRAEKKINRLKTMFEQAGIGGKYIEMVFIAPDEARKLSRKINDFIQRINTEGEVHAS